MCAAMTHHLTLIRTMWEIDLFRLTLVVPRESRKLLSHERIAGHAR